MGHQGRPAAARLPASGNGMDGEPSREGGLRPMNGQRSGERWDGSLDDSPHDDGRRRTGLSRRKPALPPLGTGLQRPGAHAAPAGARGAPGLLTLGNWPVAARLFAVIVLAAAMGLVFGGMQVATAISQANQFTRVTKLALLGQQSIVLAEALEEERAQTAMYLAANNGSGVNLPNELAQYYGPVGADGQNDPTQGITGAAADKFETLAAAIGDAYPASTRSDVSAVEQLVIANLAGMRSAVSSTGGTPAPNGAQLTALTDYNSVIPNLFSLDEVIAQGSTDSDLISQVQVLGALSRAKDQLSQQRALLWAALENYGLNQDAYNGKSGEQGIQGIFEALSTSQAQQVGFLQSYVAFATPAEQQELQTTAFRQPNASMQSIEEYLTGQNSLDLTGLGFVPIVASAQWDDISSGAIAQYGQVESRLAKAIVDRSEADQHNAERSAWETALVTGSILLLVLLAALLVARSVVLPLRRLRSSALEIASVSLPERVQALAESTDPGPTLEVTPVNVRTTDEVGQVARAFDLVHQEAVRLAGNEAMLRGSLNAMFVSLSRRSQSLIERLSRMIDSLELNEGDPERLSNLFSMDHLITRMRRNSENLLLLAGHEGGRKHTEPVLLGDVVRAATSEIEQYGRVVLSVQAGIEVSGQTATDVIHLLAEIIENATIFSPRSTEVHVMGQEIPTGGVLIEVSDSGVGISESRLEQLNWRLEHPPVVDVSVSRHMGLFAVSHLAARHGVRVRLRVSSPRGLVAMVWLPDTVAGPARTSYGERLRRLGAAGGPGRLATSAEGGTATATMPPLVAAGVAAHGANPQHGTGESGQYANGAYANGAYADSRPSGARHAGAQAGPGRASTWFRPRHAAGLPRQPAAEPAGGQPWVPPEGPPQNPWEVPGWKFFQEAPEPVDGGMTTAGLPVRVPQANRIPAGQQAQPRPAAPYEPQVSEMPATDPSMPAARFPGSLPRRSPESARSRLGGFQRGARRAEEHHPRAGEGTDL